MNSPGPSNDPFPVFARTPSAHVASGGTRTPYASLSLHEAEPDWAVIERGARQGFNDVCFQVERSNAAGLRALAERARAEGWPGRLAALGLSASVWVHELSDHRDDLGPVAADNEALWRDLHARYDRYLGEWLPWVKHVVLTVVETKVNLTEPRALGRAVRELAAACRRHGRTLIVRSFVHEPEEVRDLQASAVEWPPEVWVMTKCVAQDWSLAGVPDPCLGAFPGRRQVVECDLCGEYWGGDRLPCDMTGQLAPELARWTALGCSGVSARVTRRPRSGAWWEAIERPHSVAGQPQEAALRLLGAWARGEAVSAREALEDWAREQAPARAAVALADALEGTHEILREGTTCGGEPFGMGFLRNPVEWVMNGQHGEGRSTAARFADGKDGLYTSPWHMKHSAFRWRPERTPRYRRLRRGAAEEIAAKERALRHALAQADLRLARLERARAELPAEAYSFFHFGLAELRAHTEAAGGMMLFWLEASRWLWAENEGERREARAAALRHWDALRGAAERMAARLDVEWAGRRRLQQGLEQLDVFGFRALGRTHWCALFEEAEREAAKFAARPAAVAALA